MSTAATDSHPSNPLFPTTLKHVYTALEERRRLESPSDAVMMEYNGMRFLGMWVGLKEIFDWRRLRRSIGTLLGLEEFRIIQVVGDSGGELSHISIERAKRLIELLVGPESPFDKETIIEYGYTSMKHDANWIVNDLIASTPGLASRILANVVYMSAIVVEKGYCEAAEGVCHFVLAYGENETTFGDDVWLSDLVMSAEYSDKLVVLEGGPQTFTQSVNACSRGVPVVVVTGPGARAQRMDSTAKPRFSAAGLFALLYHKLQECADKQNPTVPEQQAMENLAMQSLDTFEDIKHSSSKYDSVLSALKTLMLEPAKIAVVEIMYIE